MRVNSAFTGFFVNRLVERSGIPIAIGMVMVVIFFIASSFTKHSDPELRAKRVNLIIRLIGHQLLLQSGDSTSRVLPVKEVKEGTFVLQFEKQFFFSYDSLIALAQGLLPKAQFPSGYTVTVHDCMNQSILYGFQIDHTPLSDNLACRGREQPEGCYLIEFAFADFYEKAEQHKTDIDQQKDELKSTEVNPQKANQIPIAVGTEEFKTTINNDIDQLSKELQALKVHPQDANVKPEEFKTTGFDYSFISLVFSGILISLGVTLLIARFGKIITPSVQNQDSSIIKELVPELSALGKFLFDVKGQRLLFESEVISLTDKECRILELLHKNFGELIPRETLMQEVWINEGVITGRSLDMFVSKLRKKLGSDPELRITNVHGKGYKLEIPGIQI